MQGMSRSLSVGLAVLLAVALLTLAVACDGGGGKTPQAEDTPGADGDARALSDLAALADGAGEDRVGRVVYAVMTVTDGVTFEGEWVIVQRPPDSRFEFTGIEDGVESRTIIINAGDKSYLCVSSGGQEICFETEESEADTSPIDPIFGVLREIAEGIGSVDLIHRSQRSIAGANATCFAVSSTLASLGEGEICFSQDGLLLYLQSRVDGARSTFEATSASLRVTDEDFEPPYDIATAESDTLTPP